MSKSTPTAEKPADKAAETTLVPPEERFWQRYSPHHELPLSGASSLALHLLFLGLLAFSAFLAYKLFGGENRSLPIEAVRVDLDGGGGGSPRGASGEGGGAKLQEAGKTDDTETKHSSEAPMKRVGLPPAKDVKIQFDDVSARYIQSADTPGAHALEKLAKANVNLRLYDGKPGGRGQGGTGTGGGSGDGKGKGTGSGRGEGKGTLSKREKRNIRWTLLFNTSSARDYVSQLQGLGAFLAFPVGQGQQGLDYAVVRDLSSRPVKMAREDIYQLNRIRWFDDNPESVGGVMSVLGIRLPAPPPHFIAFMPQELEDKLLELELKYLKKKDRNRTEDDIKETKFRLNRRGKEYEPQVTDMQLNRR